MDWPAHTGKLWEVGNLNLGWAALGTNLDLSGAAHFLPN
jgi:hypothetical protein